jgi:hypothetical protein
MSGRFGIIKILAGSEEMTKGKQMQITIDNALGSGTSLQGYVTTTLADLQEVFGKPLFYAEGDKVTVHWSVVFEGKTLATIYDWKRYDLGTPGLTEVMQYNIGGLSKDAVYLVKKALNIK